VPRTASTVHTTEPTAAPTAAPAVTAVLTSVLAAVFAAAAVAGGFRVADALHALVWNQAFCCGDEDQYSVQLTFLVWLPAAGTAVGGLLAAAARSRIDRFRIDRFRIDRFRIDMAPVGGAAAGGLVAAFLYATRAGELAAHPPETPITVATLAEIRSTALLGVGVGVLALALARAVRPAVAGLLVTTVTMCGLAMAAWSMDDTVRLGYVPLADDPDPAGGGLLPPELGLQAAGALAGLVLPAAVIAFVAARRRLPWAHATLGGWSGAAVVAAAYLLAGSGYGDHVSQSQASGLALTAALLALVAAGLSARAGGARLGRVSVATLVVAILLGLGLGLLARTWLIDGLSNTVGGEDETWMDNAALVQAAVVTPAAVVTLFAAVGRLRPARVRGRRAPRAAG
jgi:hypothetical protein